MKKALLLCVLLMFSGVSFSATFNFEGGTIYGNLSTGQAALIHLNMTKLYSVNASSFENDATCIAVCTDHVGYELLGKPLHENPETKENAHRIADRHKRIAGHTNTVIWCGNP